MDKAHQGNKDGRLQTADGSRVFNTFTSDDRTVYPVASRNDKDFTNLMNVYLDAVLFPNVATDI